MRIGKIMHLRANVKADSVAVLGSSDQKADFFAQDGSSV